MSQRTTFYELAISRESDGTAFVQLHSNGPVCGRRLVFDGRLEQSANAIALVAIALDTGDMMLRSVET